MKKTWKVVLGAVLAVSLAGVFTSCDLLNGAKKEETKTVYEISVDTESLEMVVGEDAKTVTVTTNGTAKVEVENEDVATAALEGSTITVTPVAAGSTIVTVTCNEDTTKTAEIAVTVAKNTMVLTLNIADEIAIPGGSITVLYGNGGDKDAAAYEYYAEVAATVAEDGKSAVVELDKAYASTGDWIGYNGIKITVKNADGEEINKELSANWFEFNSDGVTIEITKYVETEMTVTLTFDDFTATAVSVTYGLDDTTQETVDAVVAEGGASATFNVKKAYVNGSSWTAILKVVAKNGDNELSIEFKGDNNWFEFDSTKTDLKMEYALKSDWTELYSAAYTGTGNFEQIVTADKMPAAINAIKVEYANMSGSGDWWMQINSDGSTWDVCKGSWNGDISGYSVEITDTDLIAALKTNGVYFVAGSGLAGTLTISYN